ncbi:Hypothetical predicted protein [Cloeon dipterum]|uniref:Uncharacterized protein n=1 Tax=Cloeon dipterum TaxID=197152 RepID=A0A8S1DM98_9INSE|nr:Hypothetical predicted protein [Cloeon dipterum]
MGSASFDLVFEPSSVRQLGMMANQSVTVWTNNSLSHLSLCAFSSMTEVAEVSEEQLEFELADDESHSKYKSNFTIFGKFLGYSRVTIRTCAQDVPEMGVVQYSDKMFVSVIRVDNWMDAFFIGTITVLLFFIYINFGCALDIAVVKKTLKKPIGITIGLVSQFIFMPLMSFFIARLVFPEQPALQLGLFFIGCSPGGAASNIWTLVLDGNLDLSVTMTAVSTFASFLTIPFWVFTMGHIIFSDAEIGVPYKRIGITAISLFLPLIIGIIFQYKLPRVAKFLIKALKPFAAFMLVFIVVGTFSNLFLFRFVDWMLLIAAISNPLLGYLFGAFVAKLFRQTERDIIAISIETGIQNGAIAVLLLKTALEAPECDISAVVPVTIFITTQVPLVILLVILKIRNRIRAKREEKNKQQAGSDAYEVEIPLNRKPIVRTNT